MKKKKKNITLFISCIFFYVYKYPSVIKVYCCQLTPVFNRGVLAAVKLDHTRIFLYIKKNGIKSVISMSDSEQLRADGDIWSLDGTTRRIHV
jgi:hypothetical protein